MATHDRKSCKRKWISACCLLTKYNNHAKKQSTDISEQPSSKISKFNIPNDDFHVVNDLHVDKINSNDQSGDSDSNDNVSLASSDVCSEHVDTDSTTVDTETIESVLAR